MVQSKADDRASVAVMKGRWQSSLLLIYLLLIAGVANAQDNAMSEQNKATDITSEITEEDLASARELLGKYLVGPVPEAVELASAIAVRDMEMLAVMFDSADDSFGRDAKYIVRLIRQAQDETWQLNEIGIQAQHVVPGEEKPISSRGAIRSDTAAELVEHVSSFLERSGAGRTRISAVASNELPPMYAFPASMGEAPKAIVYHVLVENTEPEKLYVPPDAKPGNVVIASSSSGGLVVWLERDESGHLVTTDVTSVVLPEQDMERLQLLRSKLERPEDPEEAQRRIEAIRSVLPEAARDARLLGTMRSLRGNMELLNGHFAEAVISDRRRGTPSVSCWRLIGADADWRCDYRASGMSQSIPGQEAPLHLLANDLDEEQVEDIVLEIRESLADHPSVEPSNGPISIIIISPDRDGLSARVQYGPGHYVVKFRYLDRVAIDSVELIHHMGAVK